MSRRHRNKPRFKRRTEPGAPPETVQTDPRATETDVRIVVYSTSRVVDSIRIEELPRLLDQDEGVTWVDVVGLKDKEAIQHISELFGLHPLTTEDVINAHQRPKVESYPDYLFIVTRVASRQEHFTTDQVSMVLGKQFVLTFRGKQNDCFGPVVRRLQNDTGGIRERGTDFLAYTLIDAVVDSYFPVLDGFADDLEEVEDLIDVARPKNITSMFHDLRNELLVLRRALRPHREAINELCRPEQERIGDETRVFLRDCYDHVLQLMELLEVYRDMCSDLRDYYSATISNRLNEVMQVLTVISTIFIPLSFITGLYGMNFERTSPWNLPELGLRFGYFYCLGAMLLMSLTMIFYFRRRGWLGGRRF
jgi:magnesium transporter